jgi:hypothetical protein
LSHGRAGDGVVLVHRRIAQDGTPKGEIDIVRLCCDRQLHFLYRAAVRRRAAFPRDS